MNAFLSRSRKAWVMSLPARLPETFPIRRQHWLNAERLRLYSFVVLFCYGLFIAIRLFRIVWLHREIGPVGGDFLPFWSTSYLAIHGHAIDAYNVKLLTAVEVRTMPYFGKTGGLLPWVYPPTFLLVLYPFALLPYEVATAVFVGCTYALFVRTIYSIIPDRLAILIAMAFPGVAVIAWTGQNGFFTASLAGLGLVLLRRRPYLAGMCFGLLCMKPQLVVLFPLALLCSRSWRALSALILTFLLTLAVAAMAFGTGTLGAFRINASMVAACVESGGAALERMPSAFAQIKLLHGPVGLAFTAQAVSALCAAGAVCYAWRSRCSHSLRAATLVCASLLISPYIYDYDLVWYGILIAWYCRYAMVHGWRRGEREWLVVLWVAPLAGMFIAGHVCVQIMLLVSAGTLWMLVRRVGLERRAPVVLHAGCSE